MSNFSTHACHLKELSSQRTEQGTETSGRIGSLNTHTILMPISKLSKFSWIWTSGNLEWSSSKVSQARTNVRIYSTCPLKVIWSPLVLAGFEQGPSIFQGITQLLRLMWSPLVNAGMELLYGLPEGGGAVLTFSSVLILCPVPYSNISTSYNCM